MTDKSKKLIEKYPNWRRAVSGGQTLSTVLAGFCITLLALIIKEEISTDILLRNCRFQLTFGQTGCILLGVAIILFLSATHLFQFSDMFNVYEAPQEAIREYKKQLGERWDSYKEEKDKQTKKWYEWGARCYNSGILIIFVSLTAILWKYNLGIFGIIGFLIELIFFVSVESQRRY